MAMSVLREGLKSGSILDLATRGSCRLSCPSDLSSRPSRHPVGRNDFCSAAVGRNDFCSAACFLCVGWVRTVPRRRSFTRVSVRDLALENDGNFVWATDVHSELPLAPSYLVKSLAPCLVETGKAHGELEATVLAQKILSFLSLEIGHLLSLPASQRAGRLDGLMDLSAPQNRREVRRRLYQALDNMVRWFLHEPSVHLSHLDLQNGHEDSIALRSFSAMAIERKRQLRRLCQSSVAFSTSPPSGEGEEASVDAAAVHGLKQWSKAFKEWCFETIQFYFLVDEGLRSKWLTGRRQERSRVTVLTHALRQVVAQRAQQNLPKLSAEAWSSVVQNAASEVLVDHPRLLDVGSCTNYFGRLHGDSLHVTALDLAPGHSSVLSCNFLEVKIGSGSDIKTHDGPDGLVAEELPAHHFDVVVMALLFSVLPSPEARGMAAAKARRVLKDGAKGRGRGLLIIADTKGTVGRHCDPAARNGEWVKAVEANGFQLASDPQLHLSRDYVKDSKGNGYWQRAFCWVFWTAPTSPHAAPVPVPVLSDLRKPRSLSPERLEAQRMREAKRQLRARKAELLELARHQKGDIFLKTLTLQYVLRRPELTIHDLPDDMQEIEAGVQPLPPLPPLLTVLSISRALARG
eukprot:Skav219624  [mRNA]  locus=scaffold628:186573:189220:- [translate_table: standard]